MTLLTTATISRSPSMESISSSLFDFIEDDSSFSGSSSASMKDADVSFDIANLDDDDMVSLHSKSSVNGWLALVASPVPKKTRPSMASPPVSMINMSIVISDSEDESSSEQSLGDGDFGFGLTPLDDDFCNDEVQCSPGNGGATVVSLSDSENASSYASVVIEPSTPLFLDIADVETAQTHVSPVPVPAVKVQQHQSFRDWSSLRVVDLKEELKSRRLRCSGRKAVLIARLTEDDQERAALASVANEGGNHYQYGESSVETSQCEQFNDMFSDHAEMETLAQFSSDGACEAFSDEELMALMTDDLMEKPVEEETESVPAEEMSGSALTDGYLAVARVLHYLLFFQPNKMLFKNVLSMVSESFEKGVATSSLDDVPGIVFERFVEILGQDFLPIFQASVQFSEAEVLGV